MRYLIGIIGFILGLAIIKYRLQIREFTGLIGFAERYLGNGGTYNFYLLLGMATSFFSVLFATGQLQQFLVNLLSPYF